MVANHWPNSIRGINNLPDDHKQAIYGTLLPGWLANYDVAHGSAKEGFPNVIFRCPSGTRAVEITVRRHPSDRDPLLYLNMADTFNNQLLVLLVIVNDLDAPRFNIDIDQHGNPTQFGTISRNIPAELAAMRAGLAPGQIRQGLRAFKQSVPVFEQFVHNMGLELFLIEPLAYHNAIIFERYGFNYIKGKSEMLHIHQEFQPGGFLHSRLGEENAFRQPAAWKTIRGRSWAIHDGIMGYPFTGFQMYKRLGINAEINTFPNAEW